MGFLEKLGGGLIKLMTKEDAPEQKKAELSPAQKLRDLRMQQEALERYMESDPVGGDRSKLDSIKAQIAQLEQLEQKTDK